MAVSGFPADVPKRVARRDFMTTLGTLGAATTFDNRIPNMDSARGQIDRRADQIPLRPLGRTGLHVSALAVGGHHLGDLPTMDEATRLVHEAVDAGIIFFDNAWEYYNGKTETWLGQALKGRRDKVVLMTKVCTHGRSGVLAIRMLEESLRRLQTDHLDLWQIHGIVYDNDPDLAYAKGGVLEAFETAKQQGKVRFVGFTGHKDPGLHLKMLELGYPFDTVPVCGECSRDCCSPSPLRDRCSSSSGPVLLVSCSLALSASLRRLRVSRRSSPSWRAPS
jgi:hypothetical protein